MRSRRPTLPGAAGLSRRWLPLYQAMVTGLEFMIADLASLAEMDERAYADAPWAARARGAAGCLKGALALLHDAHEERAAYEAGRQRD